MQIEARAQITLPAETPAKTPEKTPEKTLDKTPEKTPVNAHASSLPIVETFYSVQGEGVWTGHSAFFIRLAGCDVGCPWCDTKYSWPQTSYPQQAIAELVALAIARRPFMVVITGGEPLIHDLTELSAQLRQAGARVHLETSGAYPLSGVFDWVTLSPKRFKPPLAEIYGQIHELKVVISAASDLVWAEVCAQSVRGQQPQVALLLQPEWGSQQGQQLAVDYVCTNPEWRLSLQTHKYLGVK